MSLTETVAASGFLGVVLVFAAGVLAFGVFGAMGALVVCVATGAKVVAAGTSLLTTFSPCTVKALLIFLVFFASFFFALLAVASSFLVIFPTVAVIFFASFFAVLSAERLIFLIAFHKQNCTGISSLPDGR